MTGSTTRRGAAATAVLALLLTTSACGGDDGGGSTEVKVIEVTLEAGAVTPDGDRIDVDVNQPIDLVVTADEPGELHLHSSPEQTFEFEAGENAPIELQFDRPGLVELELHEPASLPVLELQIS
ncbi:hypothetical protein FE634_04465 [Nocardioides dongxiaopingii]|uniref:hypothetical protein n=1 Tax=Nocardioides TaxID=1839 RepID=UPI0010C762FE|nr:MULTISPECIES: hypothetical protein [Nocardioides]QCW49854.1 hypothetical protein FE634_04465 [Nocardioides sp. S-1144]